MNPSKWEGWLKSLKYFDLWGQQNDRIRESIGLVVVRRHGDCPVLRARPTALSLRVGVSGAVRAEAVGLRPHGLGVELQAQGPLSLGPSHPFGFPSMGCGFGGKTES